MAYAQTGVINVAQDNLEPLLTQCPNCETRFKVTETQLQVAHGNVRCGACLNVFDATAHLLVDGELVHPSQGEDVDALLSEIDQQKSQLNERLDHADTELLATVIAPASEAQSAEQAATVPVERGDDPLDELAALEAELMAELKGETATAQSLAQAEQLLQAANAGAKVSLDDAAEVPRDAVVQPQPHLQPPPETTPRPEQASPGQSIELADTQANQADEQAARSPYANLTLEREIPPELLLDETPPKRSWVTWVFMLVALLALLAQLMWYKFDEWSKIESLRPGYAQACQWLGCELPVRRNVGLISARNSVLRDHPDVDQALVYDTLLVNQASYEQPFPLVELTLLSLRGQLVASRRFKPAEYLNGELSGGQLMPPQTPIHISLAIKDPGEAPLNFQIRFLPYD